MLVEFHDNQNAPLELHIERVPRDSFDNERTLGPIVHKFFNVLGSVDIVNAVE